MTTTTTTTTDDHDDDNNNVWARVCVCVCICVEEDGVIGPLLMVGSLLMMGITGDEETNC